MLDGRAGQGDIARRRRIICLQHHDDRQPRDGEVDARTATKSYKPYEVSKGGTVVGWIWARGYDNALALTARSEGYTVSTGKTKEVTKDDERFGHPPGRGLTVGR